MSPIVSHKTPAENYIEATETLESVQAKLTSAAMAIRRAMRCLKRANTAQIVTTPKPPTP